MNDIRRMFDELDDNDQEYPLGDDRMTQDSSYNDLH